MSREIKKDVISYLKKEKIVTSSEIANKVGVSWNTAERHLLDLTIDGKIERIKKAGVNLWVLK